MKCTIDRKRYDAHDNMVMSDLWDRLELIRVSAIRKFVTAYGYQAGNSWADLEQEAYLALVRAVETYDPDKSTLVTWYSHILTNHLKSIYSLGHNKTDALDCAVSLDAPDNNQDDDGETLLDKIASPVDAVSQIEDLMSNRQSADLCRLYIDQLSDYDKRLLAERYLCHMSADAMAAKRGITRDKVYNDLRRAKRNLQDLMISKGVNL